MTRGPLPFRQADVTRAIRGAIAAGIEPHVEIDRSGRIVIERANSAPPPAPPNDDAHEWDDAE